MKNVLFGFLLVISALAMAQSDTFKIVRSVSIKPQVQSKEANGIMVTVDYDFSTLAKAKLNDSLLERQSFTFAVQFALNDTIIRPAKGYFEHMNSQKNYEYYFTTSGLTIKSFPAGSKSFFIPHAAFDITEGKHMVKPIVSVSSTNYKVIQKSTAFPEVAVTKPAVLKVKLSIPTLQVSALNNWDISFFSSGSPDPDLHVGVGGLNLYSKSLTNTLTIFSGNTAQLEFAVCEGDAFTIKIFDSDTDTNDFIGKLSFRISQTDRNKEMVYTMPFDWIDKVKIVYSVY